MSLFELVRVWEAWPKASDSEGLRDLFRQAPTRSRQQRPTDVFLFRSHLFIVTCGEGGDPVVRWFHCHSSEASTDQPACLPLTRGRGDVVGVWSVRAQSVNCEEVRVGSVYEEREVWVARARGDLEIFTLNSGQWRLTGDIRLTQGQCLLSCAVHVTSSTIIYCEGPSTNRHGCSVSCRTFDLGQSPAFGVPTVVLTACPPLTLLSCKVGVALCPPPATGPEGLLLFWLPWIAALKPYICSQDHYSSALSSELSLHFPSLCLRLAALWAQVPQELQILSVTVHPVTGQFLTLLSSGEVREVREIAGKMKGSRLVRLAQFCFRYYTNDILSAPAKAAQPRLELFAVQTYYGLFKQGEIRLYDSFTGEFVWECDGHEGPEARLLSPPFSSQWPGLLTGSGVWVLRSRRLLDHARLLANALFPITTNADETTPGDYLEHGRTLAARLCKLWSLQLPATRYALAAVHGIVKQDREEEVGQREKELFLPDISSELLQLLRKGTLQDPALLVALLAQFSRYQPMLRETVCSFLAEYNSHNVSTNLLTSLNLEVVPLLEHYLSLCDGYDSALADWGRTGPVVPTDRTAVAGLLRRMEAHMITTEVPSSLRSQLLLASYRSPREALSGIKDFLCIDSFEAAVQQIESGVWQCHRNWKTIFGTEFGGSQQGGRVDGQSANLPLFEMLCRLLYELEPQQLVACVQFAHLSRDYQMTLDSAFARKCRKTYYFNRALEALPELAHDELATPTKDTLICHSILLIHSDRCGRHVMALKLLLQGKLWEEVLALLQAVPDEDPATNCTLFHIALAHMIKENSLHTYIKAVWDLRPKTYSLFDFLHLLRTSLSTSSGSRLHTSQVFTDEAPLTMSHVQLILEPMIDCTVQPDQDPETL